jgi:hypothetical protein
VRRTVAASALALGVVLLHLATRAHELSELDSINLAKGLAHFDVRTHSPHPPGYPLVVGSAHLLSWLGTPVPAYVALAVLFSLATLAATYACGRELFGARAGLVAAAVVLATPLFLYYGDIVSVYLPEAAGAAVVVLLAARLARGKGRADVLLLPVLALAAGYRPTMLLLLAPVVVVAVWAGRPRAVRVALSALAAAAIVAAWAVPTIVMSGGLGAYNHASSALYGDAAAKTSVFAGASANGVLTNVAIVLACTASLAVPGAVVLLIARRRPRPVADRVAWWLLAAWVAPYLLLYLLVHFGKPGYALAYVPALAIATGGLVSDQRALTRTLAAVAAVGVAAYALLPAWPLPVVLRGFWPTARSVREQDAEARGLRDLARRCPRGQCYIVSLPGTPRFWYHDPRSLGEAYAPGARVIRTTESAMPRVRGHVYWVGERVVGDLPSIGRPLPRIGSWHVFETDGAETVAVVLRLRRAA